jgi:hypothetical protein
MSAEPASPYKITFDGNVPLPMVPVVPEVDEVDEVDDVDDVELVETVEAVVPPIELPPPPHPITNATKTADSAATPNCARVPILLLLSVILLRAPRLKRSILAYRQRTEPNPY